MNYRIYDHIEDCWLKGIYKTRRAASRRADRLDLEYGAIRYSVHFIPVLEQEQRA